MSADGESSTAAGLLALMTVDGVGPAKALAVARGDQAADKLADRATLVAACERAQAEVTMLAAEGVRTIGFFDEASPGGVARDARCVRGAVLARALGSLVAPGAGGRGHA